MTPRGLVSKGPAHVSGQNMRKISQEEVFAKKNGFPKRKGPGLATRAFPNSIWSN
jgi:hypothetical protein